MFYQKLIKERPERPMTTEKTHAANEAYLSLCRASQALADFEVAMGKEFGLAKPEALDEIARARRAAPKAIAACISAYRKAN